MLLPLPRVRALLLLPVLLLGPVASITAQTCVLQATFDGVGLPAGWDGGALVEQQDANGAGLGTFTAPWTVGTSTDANAGGYFPVPDGPPGNRFAMANDDAPPCNCAMSSVALTTPVLDLSAVNNGLVDLRYFLDGAFGADSAWVEASNNNVDWTWLAALPVSGAAWAWATVDLGAYDGQSTVNVRFHWSDDSTWASGFAVDEICIRGAVDHDLSLEEAFVGDPQVSAFDPGIRSLAYDQLPLEQTAPLVVGAAVRNRGHVPLFNVVLHTNASLNGASQGDWVSDTLAVLAPGARDTLLIQTGWTPASVGQVQVSYLATSGGSEDFPGDETGQQAFQVTGPGWSDGDGAMALRKGLTEGGIDKEGRPYRAGCRYELGQQDQVHGLSVRLGDGSYPGARILGLLMDGNLQPIASTDTLLVSAGDIAEGLAGGWTFLAFNPAVDVQAGDVWALMEHLPDSGRAVLATAGSIIPGSAIVWDEDEQLWSYPLRAPLVRMHLAPVAVGWEDRPELGAAGAFAPNPASGHTTFTAPWPVVDLEVYGPDGRSFRIVPANGTVQRIDVSAWPEGLYLVRGAGSGGRVHARLIVTR